MANHLTYLSGYTGSAFDQGTSYWYDQQKRLSSSSSNGLSYQVVKLSSVYNYRKDFNLDVSNPYIDPKKIADAIGQVMAVETGNVKTNFSHNATLQGSYRDNIMRNGDKDDDALILKTPHNVLILGEGGNDIIYDDGRYTTIKGGPGNDMLNLPIFLPPAGPF